MNTELNPDIAHVCPSCDGATGVVRDDGMIVCAKCSHTWHPDYDGGDKSTVKVQVGDGVYMEFYGNDPWGTYIDTDRWLEAVGDASDESAQRLQSLYDAINGRDEFRYSYDYDVVDAFFEEVPGVTREGENCVGWVNTYNGECELDSTLEILTFLAVEPNEDPDEPADPLDGEFFIMVRRHMGGDVRGNYASPVIMRLYEWGEQFDYRVSVDLPPVEPDGDTLPGLEDTRYREWETFDVYEFDRWLEAEGLEMDWRSARRGVPRLTNGRAVLFSSSPVMNG